MKRYNFTPTLLDTFTGYLKYKNLKSLIDCINRVPFESEAADRGTAFNEVVDCIVENRKSKRFEISADESEIAVMMNGKIFKFSKELAKCIATPLKEGNALTQYRVEGTLPTQYGEVFLYGYLDYLLPFMIVDLKTTGKYNVFKYRNNWQHIVYPYCLNQQGIEITDFEYLVTDFKGVYKEAYAYMPKLDTARLKEVCERFIEFLEGNRELITDKKIFNEQNA